MQGKILIVDGISTNRIVLKVKLTAAFYSVAQAGSLEEAAHLIPQFAPDLVLTAMNLPDGTAAELAQHLGGADTRGAVPVLAVASSLDPVKRLEALRAGVFDVMNKPVDDTFLLSRVRNIIRAHRSFADWQMRDDARCAFEVAEAPGTFAHASTISLIGTGAAPLQGWVRRLSPHLRACYSVTALRNALAGLHAKAAPDAIVLSLPPCPQDSEICLRLISALRASAQTQDTALIAVQSVEDPVQATSALDIGVDDIMTGGFDAPEVAVRLQKLIQRKQQAAQLLQNVRSGLRAAVNDPLTGLYNRRYAMPFLNRLAAHSRATGARYALLIADMDHFKQINDAYGHASGDSALIEVARRLCDTVQAGDMVARMGGEEFLIALPDTDEAAAYAMAERVCHAIGSVPFSLPGCARPVPLTISVGLSICETNRPPAGPKTGDVDAMMNQADKALYEAKVQGRNRVNCSLRRAKPAA